MIGLRPANGLSRRQRPNEADLPNGRVKSSQRVPGNERIVAGWSRFGPYLVSSVLLILGYLHYAPGTAYSLSAEHYRAWSFPAFRYSDLIWLYLRDELDRRPLPYIDYPLEYPPLTGLVSWLLSWAPDLPAYFAFAYALLAASALLTIWALQRVSGANVWLFAASPALFFYTGHQWDMAAIGITALALLAVQRGRDGWGIAGLVIATSLKLFPVVFIAATVVERIRDRRYRSAAGLSFTFAAGTLAINLPVALLNFAGWSFFFRWNRDRLADSGIWVLWRGVPTEDLTRWSAVAALTGAIALSALVVRSRGPIMIPLGATYLLWWLLVNKTFTTHLMLWVFLSLALLSAPWWLWGLTAAIDLVGFQVGNYLNLYNVSEFQNAPLIRKAVENIYDPMQIARSVMLLVSVLWGVHVLRMEGLRARYAAITVKTRSHPDLEHVPSESSSGSRVKAWLATVGAGHAVPLPRRGATGPQPSPDTHLAAGPEQNVDRRRALLRGAAVTFAFAAVTVLMTWPYVRYLGSGTVVGFDPFLQIWLSEWIQHALATDPLRLYQANIFYPFAQTLAYTDANVPGALLAAPLRFLTGDPLVTNSLLVLATFVVAATGVYALIVSICGNRGAAFIAGLAYAFLPYRMVHLWHLNWLEGALLPWVVLALLRLIDRPSIGRGFTLGLLAAILVLTSFYFSIQLAMIGVVIATAWSVAARRRPTPAFFRSVVVAGGVALAITVPLYAPYLQVRGEQHLERSIVDAEQYKALPTSFLQLAPWDAPNPVQRLLTVRAGANESLTEVGQAPHADGHQHGEIVIEDALYPGAVAMVFAVIGLLSRRPPRWLAVALAVTGLIALILSLGPSFGPRHAQGPPLPYGWLFDHVPFFRAMRVPARLGGLTNLTIVLLAGLGLASTWDGVRANSKLQQFLHRAWAGPALTAVLAAAVLADLWTGAIPIETVERGAAALASAKWLATQPAGPVMEFPAESVFTDPAAASVRRHYGEAMFWSTLHWKPLVNGNSGFIPRAYSDFIERFVGVAERPDGSTTPRISHLDADTARLLQQLGVRYLVFHRDQYREADWPAVTSQLAPLVEDGLLAPAGEYGAAATFVLNPAIPAVQPPAVSIFAPTLITPDSGWATWVVVETDSGTPSVLALTQPPQLEATWFDNEGKRLRSGVQNLPLPVVLDEPRLLCGVASCLTSRPFDDLSRLPPPEADGSWQPTETGHYVVRLRLSGDRPLDCRIDLDLVVDAAEVSQRSRDDPYRWAECTAGHRNPVNNPGAVPFDLSPPSITLVHDTAVVDIALTSRRDEEVRGWFTLAPPGSSRPWQEAVYQAPVQQKLVPANQPTAFEWQASIGAAVDPGVYGLTVWFHRLGPSGWEHAAGGDINLAPVVVDDSGSLRWAGPIRVRLAGPPKAFPAARSTRLNLGVSGVSNRLRCVASWRLYSGLEVVASGNGGACDEPEIALPATVAPGQYRLQIDASADRDGDLSLSDAVSFPITVIAQSPWETSR